MTTILVVDDSRVTREVIKVYLIAKDMNLVEASDGVEALNRVQSAKPDLILADLHMPHLDGAALCEALRANPATRSIPVVILTAHRDVESARRCMNAGAWEVLAKPIQPKPLLAAVARCLGLHASNALLRRTNVGST